ncbi:hypothetical protein R6Q59_034692 [Mikania micrantha]
MCKFQFSRNLQAIKRPKLLSNFYIESSIHFTRHFSIILRSIMCYGSQRLPSFRDDGSTPSTVGALPPADVNIAAVDNLRLRLAETEARLQRARAREAQLIKKLLEMKRFVSVMEILETYLKRRFLDQQQLAHLISRSSVPK